MVENLGANVLADDLVARLFELARAIRKPLGQSGHRAVDYSIHRGVAFLFAGGRERFCNSVADVFLHRLEQRRVRRFDLELALGLARELAKLFLNLEQRTHRLVRREQRLDNRVFLDDPGAALEHHDRVRLARDHQRDIAFLELADLRADHDLAADPAHPHRSNGSVVWDIGDLERGRGSDQCERVGVVVVIGAQHRHDNLGFLVIALGKQRAHRAVDQARGKDFFFRGAAFALEKSAGNLAGGESLFDVIDGERQKIDLVAALVFRGRGREHHGIAVLGEHGAVRLFGKTAGFERQLPPGKFNL